MSPHIHRCAWRSSCSTRPRVPPSTAPVQACGSMSQHSSLAKPDRGFGFDVAIGLPPARSQGRRPSSPKPRVAAVDHPLQNSRPLGLELRTHGIALVGRDGNVANGTKLSRRRIASSTERGPRLMIPAITSLNAGRTRRSPVAWSGHRFVAAGKRLDLGFAPAPPRSVLRGADEPRATQHG